MSTYLASKHSAFLASLPAPPVMPIQHGPSDLKELADHFERVSFAFMEYAYSIAREARSLNANVNPIDVAKYFQDAAHDCDLAQSIRDEAESMSERLWEQALENA